MKSKINKSESKGDGSFHQNKAKGKGSKPGFKKLSADNSKMTGKKYFNSVKNVKNETVGNKINLKRKNTSRKSSFTPKQNTSLKDSQSTGRTYLLFQPGCWNSEEFPNDPVVFEPITKEKEKELENLATKIMREEVEIYKSKIMNMKGGKYNWLKTVSINGTSGDKMAAFIYFVQESPLHNISYINSLVTLLNKEKRSLESLETMKDLFLQDLLPKNRKLKSFNQHPLGLLDELSSGNKDSKNKRLLLWHFECLLKQAYADFISALEVFSRDTVEAVRKKCIGIIWELLKEHPEQEKLLLQMLVNKLGDPSAKVASYNIHLIHKLLLRHKRMNLVIALETERLLYRTNVSRRAQFYAICMLGGLKLQDNDTDLACRLLDIFFGFFKLYISKGDIETKMLSAILTGVNKIFPHAKANKEKVLEQMEALYKICHMTKFNTSIQALTLLHQIMNVSDESSDRYYVLLYKKLLDPELPTSNKLPLFLNLLCQSMKKDEMIKRVQAFVKRLLQICHSMSPPLVCSSLLVLSEVAKEKPDLIKFEKDVEDEDSDDEHFEDEDDDDGTANDGKSKEDDGDEDNVDEDRPQVTGKVSWVHRNNNIYRLDHYDPLHRNPLYCRADLECTWELVNLVNHCHPTISLFAKTLLEGGVIKYSGDPLADFTFKRFLERFVSKNPKKDANDSGETENKRVKDADEDSVNDDEDVADAVDDDNDIDFGSDFGDIFKDEDDEDDLSNSDDDDSSVIDELTEDEDGGMDALGVPSEKALKQMKWEDAQDKKSGRKRKTTFTGRKGLKAKKHRK